MRPFVLALAALAFGLVHPAAVESRVADRDEGSPSRGGERSDAAVVAGIDAVARRYNLAGEVLVARRDRVLLDRGYGTVRPDGGAAHRAGERWRLASITKQVTAALMMRIPLTLDLLDREIQPTGVPPTATPIQQSYFKLTARMLLTHHTGLANPDDTPVNAGGVPAFYTGLAPAGDYCVSKAAKPGAPFMYNNCDYILAGEALRHAFPTGEIAWPSGITMARPDEVGIPGYVGGRPEPSFQLASWGAAGGLMGTARAVFDFDRSLMTGRLLPPAALAELWKPEGNGSYQALGQWVFPGRLAGCAAPKRIVQRDGEIYGVQARNFILPEDDLVVVFFTNRSADDFPIGEVWQGRGFAYDLLSAAAAC